MTRLGLIVILSAVGACAQATKSELLGIVRDAAQLPIAGATLALKNKGTGASWKAATQSDGSYDFLALPAGAYSLVINRESFRTVHRDGLELHLGERLSLDIELPVGVVTDSVVVNAAAPLLQSTRGTVAFTAVQKHVTTLPLDGRNFIPLIALSPGVSLPPGSLLPRINGSRPRTSEYIYDGISVLQPEPGQVAFYPIIDAIDEFRVETNSYSAEYGRSNGGIIMVNMKSGTNGLHGTLFEFFRNEALNARNLFATTGPKPLFRRNQYGFVLGGPLRRNRTFFFTDWQGTRLETGLVRQSTVPTLLDRQGVFRVPIYHPLTGRQNAFPGNAIPASRLDPVAVGALDRYPLPTSSGTANNYRRTGTETTAQDQFDIRLDHYLNASQRLSGRYTFLRDWSQPVTPLPDGSGAIASGVISDTLTRADSIVAEHSWTLPGNRVNQLRFGYTRRGFSRDALKTATYDVTGFQQLGPPSSGNGTFTTSVTQLIDSLALTTARHSVKAGMDLRWEALDVLQPPNPLGLYQFTNVLTAGLGATGAPLANTGSSFASFLLGQVQNFNIDVQETSLKPRAKIAEFYTQDDWRVSPRLTVNLGVRYTLNFPSTVQGDQGAVFDLDTQQLEFLGNNGYPRSARNLELGNFGPRAGLAFQFSNSLVMRAGYGLTWIEQAGITTPFTTPLFPFIRSLSQRSLDNIQAAFTLANGPTLQIGPADANSGLGQGVFAVQRDQKSGYAQQWNFSLQKTLGTSWSIEAGYLGSKLTNLGVPDVNLNQLSVEQLSLGASLTEQVANPYYGEIPASSSLGGANIARQQLLRPFPRFTTVTLYRNNVGHSTYHSLQARVEKRFAQGLSWTVSYTLSRLIDDAGAVFDAAILTGPATTFQAADSLNRRLEKDVSTGNIPHSFSSGLVYDLPFGRRRLIGGWSLGTIVRIQSGSPVAVTQATNFNAFAGFGIQRPNRIADPALDSTLRSSSRWFNTAAFEAAPQFTIGNSSRNPIVGPGYNTVDVMLGKTFVVGERLRVEFRAEAFNAMNAPPLGNPNGSFGTPAFGSITTALDPRVFEGVLKLHF